MRSCPGATRIRLRPEPEKPGDGDEDCRLLHAEHDPAEPWRPPAERRRGHQQREHQHRAEPQPAERSARRRIRQLEHHPEHRAAP